jgi:beta-N-acetylglucosaminidase
LVINCLICIFSVIFQSLSFLNDFAVRIVGEFLRSNAKQAMLANDDSTKDVKQIQQAVVLYQSRDKKSKKSYSPIKLKQQKHMNYYGQEDLRNPWQFIEMIKDDPITKSEISRPRKVPSRLFTPHSDVLDGRLLAFSSSSVISLTLLWFTRLFIETKLRF